MHSFPSNVYSSTVLQEPYYTTHAQCMLHPHISREGASNDVKVLRAFYFFWTHFRLRLWTAKVKGQKYYLTGPEGMQKTTANNRTHTDGKIHVYTDMHVGHVPDVVLRLSCTGGEDS